MSTDVSTHTKATPPRARAGHRRRGTPPVVRVLLDGVRRNMRQYGMLFALGLIVLLFQIWTGGDLLLPRNVSNLVLQNSYILILAIGMMIVIISGHIDLSVGSLMALVGGVGGAVLMVEHHLAWPVAVLLTLLLGGAVAGGRSRASSSRTSGSPRSS